MDEGADEDSVSMPHQIYTPTGGRPGEAGGDVDHPPGASVDSTHFDERSPNPLYNATDDLHFPINAELKMSFESDYFGQTPEGAVGAGYVPTSLVAPPRNSINSWWRNLDLGMHERNFAEAKESLEIKLGWDTVVPQFYGHFIGPPPVFWGL